MFSVRQKRELAEKVQAILRETNHPELPKGEIQFSLHVDGAESWSWADIRNNGAVSEPGANPWNEAQDKRLVRENGTGEGICPKCSRRVQTVYRYRDLDLENPTVNVPNVLVSVCQECDAIVSVPWQSNQEMRNREAK